MGEEKGKKPPRIGLISLASALVAYTLVFSSLTGHLVTPLEGKGAGLVIILFMYAIFRLALTLALWARGRVRKRSV
jgi:hypothetical protein